ncbi:MAG: sigma 54 modulation/S30EA ribosomal C-terminal domain-containing protein [Butyricicoccaceae bacterium]
MRVRSTRWQSRRAALDRGGFRCSTPQALRRKADERRTRLILQMNLLDHQFYFFRNADNDNIHAVVYKRAAGGLRSDRGRGVTLPRHAAMRSCIT